ncbi:hypothetical protein BDP27DRAFT_526702 [Rhodocollybia butyracea]|uniref:Uncharacterized protein n=1 Tax=Rhodocollybia butyracea TaxID=206335 RepID=A0A9P5UAS2_9AGAR|nr:hypothetical protein BDP27DRAFT_526702 [Rhodocollybia butyracea]
MSTASTSSTPVLPVELVQLIMKEFWVQIRSTSERSTFMKSSLGVCRTWTALYMGLFCKDVHIPSGDFALKFLQVLRNQSPFYNYYTHGGALLNQECRSLSFQCDRDGLVEAPYQCSGNGNVSDPTIPEHPMGIAIHTVLRALYFTPYFVPNLRRISILYNNSLMRDLFRRNNFTGFPPQVTELEIDFTYDPRTPLAVLDAISTNEDCIGLVPGSMRNVKLLHAIGLTQAALNELKLACSNWEEMEIESWRVGQDEDEKREESTWRGQTQSKTPIVISKQIMMPRMSTFSLRAPRNQSIRHYPRESRGILRFPLSHPLLPCLLYLACSLYLL